MKRLDKKMIPKELLEFAAKSYGFNAHTLKHIPRSSGKIENQVYTFSKGDEKYIIKFEPPSAVYNNQLLETRALMDLNHYLAENNIGVAKPLKTLSGELVLCAQDGDYIITAFARLRGKTWAYEGWNSRMSFNWGKVMGDMHRAVKDYRPPNEYDVQKDIFDSHQWGSLLDSLRIYPGVHKIAWELLEEIRGLLRERDSFGIIHGDMHQGNIFIDGEQVSVFDFGDSIYGWFTLDIAVSLCHALWWSRKDDTGNDFTEAIIENFIRGYLSANGLSGFQLSKIPMFMKYRHLCMDPERNGIGCNREGCIYNIENDILFDAYDLESIWGVIKSAVHFAGTSLL